VGIVVVVRTVPDCMVLYLGGCYDETVLNDISVDSRESRMAGQCSWAKQARSRGRH
jgi:hypothetical protein